jgi:type I restriction enzyme S subunit
VCHVYQPETISQKQMIAGECRVYGANGQIGWHNQFNHEEPELILGCRGSCGAVHVTEPRSWINGNAMVVHPTNGAMDISFLSYALKGGIELTDAITGAAQPQITAKAHAENNLKNARALFESHLQSVFTQRGMHWDNVTLETLLERGWIESHLDGNHGGDYPRKEEFVKEGVPYISANCLDDDDRIDMSRAKYLSPTRAALLRKGIAKNNDVLFAHNATVGPVAMLQTGEEKVILGTSLTYYRCNKKHIFPEYLAHYMRSFGFKKQYLQVMRQSTRNQVPITKQREFFHVIPPLDEQKRIVVALDGLLENGQRLVHLYERKHAALEALKKSLLHQAFAGEL